MTPPCSAYVHIPFCRRRCYYCDFPVKVLGDRLQGEHSGTVAQYVDWLCREIAVTPTFGAPLQTIFFGGGTPSLLSVGQLHRILSALDQRFGFSAATEISLEIDPGTFDQAQLKGYRSLGVNRLSLGVQAFQSELLALCGRSHTVEDIERAVDLIRQAQVPNLNLDLIAGLPHQTLEQWQAALEQAIAIAPNHLSCYDLILESGTVFNRQYRPGHHPLPTDETTAQMYRLAQQVLTEAGFEHYEVSNYARSGYQCRHNRVYWENRPYYGFGMGAASYVQGQRFTRPRKTWEYYQWVQDFAASGGRLNCPTTAENEVLLDTLMLGLRLAEGLDLRVLAERFGMDRIMPLLASLQPYAERGWVDLVSTNAEETSWPSCAAKLPATAKLRLSDPEGFLFSNTILATLFKDLG